MNIYDLGGHSGCHIFMIEEDDGRVFVRKISKDRAYNDRLKKQCEKQAAFSGDRIDAPEVYTSGYTEEGLFFFDMEYIQGITLSEYIKTMEIGKIRGLVEALVHSMVPKQNVEMTCEEEKRVEQIFLRKVEDLKKTLASRGDETIHCALKLLEGHSWKKFTPSACHGDMTLENIIIKSDKLYFIDFLDSFYDAWLLDIGTLLQDIQVLWSYRHQKNISMNTILRLIVFRDLLLDEIKRIDESYVLEMYYSLLLKLIRIFPYVRDSETDQFLHDKTELIIAQIQNLEDVSGEVAI